MKTAIISTVFPSPGGVATYTKYLFDESKKIDKDLIMIADNIDKKVEEDKRIIRCWDHSPKYVFQIYKEVKKNNIKRVHIQQELHLFGNKITAFMLPFFILFLRFMGIETIVTLHGVVPLKEVNRDFLKENGYSGNPFIMKFGLNLLYSLICFSSNKIIVHEPKFKDYLKDYIVNEKKIYIVKHGIKSLINLIQKNEAKKKLGIKNSKYTFLYFGYVTGYKGIEILMDAIKEIKDDDFNLIIVGSEHPRLKEEKNYKDYYKNIRSFFKKDSRCLFTGYVDEKDINYYFRSSDCAIFPYTVQMSSSGPMSLGIANEIICIASEVFYGVLPDELIFKKDKDSLIYLMKKAKSGKLNKYLKTIKKMKENLSWKNIAKETMRVWEI